MITKELLEQSIQEHKNFISMVCKNKYGHEKIEDVIQGVIDYCHIQDKDHIEFLKSGKFIPGGSILSACNSKGNISFSNCYTTPIKQDSMDGIFDCQKELANTFKYRGGSGFDLTTLRPKDCKVNNSAKTSSGSVSFLPSFSEVGRTVGQNGRRAAMIGLLDIRHPDTIDFIRCKAYPELVFEKDIFGADAPPISSINLSLKITDEFMKAVESDGEWTFIFPDIDHDKELYNMEWDGDYDKWGGKFKEYGSVSARSLLNLISDCSHKCGDPGIIFIDTAQRNTFGTYIHEDLKPVSSNPCGEELMANYNNCLLGAFVLPKYINEFMNFDWDNFEEDIKLATQLMNIFSNINETKHPLKEQIEMDKFGKRIGIELTGFADVLAIQGVKYGDSDSLYFAEELTNTLLIKSITESCEIAKYHGCCDALKEDKARLSFIDNSFIELPDGLKEDIGLYGLANTSFTTIGPCGSISILSDNCTSGIEPLFKFSYKRKNRIDNKEYEFIHYTACKEMLENFDEYQGLTLEKAKEKLCYLETNEINWKDRINIQSNLQKNIDASISSTINLPNNCTKEDIYDIYNYAYSKNLKGVTIFRDGCKEGVLSSVKKKEEVIYLPQVYEKELLDKEDASRHRVIWKKNKLYVNVSLDDDGNPLEIFAKLPKEAGINGTGLFNPTLYLEKTSHWDSICRLVSMLLRYSIPLEDIIKQLDRSTYSMVDAAGILKRILSKYLFLNDDEDDMEIKVSGNGMSCPDCGLPSYFYEGGCYICKDCGYSKCG